MKIVDLIKYEGDNNVFIWKYPGEDFNTLSQLIVHESQEALFFKDGQALDLFDKAGKYTLHTKNIPLLRHLVNIPTDGESPFHCEVYFINKTEQMAINWGMGDVNYIDPTNNNYVFKIGAFGEMSIRINDSRKIITKLVGTEIIFDQELLKKYFKTPITTYIKNFLPNILRDKCVSIFAVEAHLVELSEILKEKISKEMSEYGICLEKFWINTITKPENDQTYITLNRQRGEQLTLVNQGELDIQRTEYERRKNVLEYSGVIQKQQMDVDLKRYEQEQLKITQQEREGYEIMKILAANEGSGSDLRNAAMGIGVGFGAGGVLGNAFHNIAQNTMVSSFGNNSFAIQTPVVENTMDSIPGVISLKEESEPVISDDMSDFKNKVEKLKMMKEAGLLSESEFEEKRQELLRLIM